MKRVCARHEEAYEADVGCKWCEGAEAKKPDASWLARRLYTAPSNFALMAEMQAAKRAEREDGDCPCCMDDDDDDEPRPMPGMQKLLREPSVFEQKRTGCAPDLHNADYLFAYYFAKHDGE